MLATRYNTKEWLDEQTTVVKDYNKKNNPNATDAQAAVRSNKIEERRLTEEVFPAMKKVGGRPVVDYLFTYAADGQSSPSAVASRSPRSYKDASTRTTGGSRARSPLRRTTTPRIRSRRVPAPRRVPKDLPGAQHPLQPKKWKVRWVAASLVLLIVTTKQVPDFMARLPKTPATKMGMTEPLSYGGAISEQPQLSRR